jgi:hypothetical protein
VVKAVCRICEFPGRAWLAIGRARHSVRAVVKPGGRRTNCRRAEDCPPYLRRDRRRNQLQQLVWIDVHGDSDVFREGQFVEGFADEPTEAQDCFAADQDVKAKLAL